MKRQYYVIDAFAAEPFSGNPAAVVLDADGLDEGRMQQVAAEFNLSETTFVLPAQRNCCGEAADLSVRFRWFTPTAEVDMCGHATVAGLWALIDAGRAARDRNAAAITVRIETRSGVLTGFVEELPGRPEKAMIWLELPRPELTAPSLDVTALCGALGASGDVLEADLPPVRTQDADVILFVRDVAGLNGLRPGFSELADLMRRGGIRGLCVATTRTLTPSVHVQSRFFAPTVGVDEDPVTGSVHGPLAVYLVERGVAPIHDGVAAVTCVQGKPGDRAGLLHALVRRSDAADWSVRIGGRAVVTMRGVLEVD